MKHVPATFRGLTLLVLVLAAGGCETPVADQTERDLQQSVLDSARREMIDASRFPDKRTTEAMPYDDLRIKPELVPELQRMAGPEAYAGVQLPLEKDLLGQPTRTRRISLEHAVRAAARNNLTVQFARLGPAVNEAQLVAAQAAFDWVFFSNLTASDLDQPRTATVIGTTVTGVTSLVQDQIQWNAGLRKALTTGGQITIQQELSYVDDRTPNQDLFPDPGNQAGVTLQLDQPLLRGAGSDTALAEVRLARNAERSAVAALKRDLIRQISDTERTYWQLVRAVQDVRIFQRLLERGLVTRQRIEGRIDLDATPAQVADTVARVERRRADLLRSQTALKQLSDRLKGLINDPDLPVGSEVLVIPADAALDAPLEFSLLDIIQTAVVDRPEITQAVLSIDDTSIRKVVADNGRLPKLDLRFQTRFGSLENDPGTAYTEVFDGNFVDYVVGLVFEQPIGNRKAEADYRRRNLERYQAIISYRNTVQQILVEVKAALEAVTQNYRLIGQTRSYRLAATEVLRALQVENELLRGLTVERLDLELNRQEALANAEREEIQAIADYNSSIADLYSAMGRSLERNGIKFDVPSVDDTRAAKAALQAVRAAEPVAREEAAPAPGEPAPNQ